MVDQGWFEIFEACGTVFVVYCVFLELIVYILKNICRTVIELKFN